MRLRNFFHPEYTSIHEWKKMAANKKKRVQIRIRVNKLKKNIERNSYLKFNQRNEKFFPAFRTKRKQNWKKHENLHFFFFLISSSGKNIRIF